MRFLHFFRSASLSSPSLLRSDREHPNKADDDAASHHSKGVIGAIEEVAGTDEGLIGGTKDSKDSSRLMGSFLTPRSQSPSPSSHPSDLPPSEYNSLEAEKSSKWYLFLNRTSAFPTLRHSRWFWIITGLLTMGFLTTILTTALVLTLHVHKANAKIDSTVNLGYSKYQGVAAADNKIVKWLGVRYAAPPVGDLRFKAPQAPLQNSTVQQADKYGPVCLPTPSTGIADGTSEDCLFLNVYAPVDSSKTRPVFVYIQGGGFNSNAGANYDGASLIEAGDHDMIVVDFNYRVGPWGFLASKEIKAGGDLNAGLLDQRMVLQWVQKYIHLFGGDPKRVTLGGASAGAASVDLHLSAYGGRDDGLFHAVAAESQSWGAQLTVEESQYQYDGLVSRVGCNGTADTLACLRKLDISVIAKHNAALPIPGGAGSNPVFPYSDVIDGNLVQDYTYNLFATGRFIKVPALFGDVTNEGTLFTPKDINNYNDVNNFLKNNFVKLTATHLAQINFLYPKAEQFPGAGQYWRTAANAYGDMRYFCPGIWISTIFNDHGTTPYLYHWNIASQANLESGLGVTHCDESNSIWGMASSLPQSALNPLIQGYWQSFIRTGGDPNKLRAKGAPEWKKLDGTGLEKLMFVSDPSKVAMVKIPKDTLDRCNYLTTIGGSLGQ